MTSTSPGCCATSQAKPLVHPLLRTWTAQNTLPPPESTLRAEVSPYNPVVRLSQHHQSFLMVKPPLSFGAAIRNFTILLVHERPAQHQAKLRNFRGQVLSIGEDWLDGSSGSDANGFVSRWQANFENTDSLIRVLRCARLGLHHHHTRHSLPPADSRLPEAGSRLDVRVRILPINDSSCFTVLIILQVSCRLFDPHRRTIHHIVSPGSLTTYMHCARILTRFLVIRSRNRCDLMWFGLGTMAGLWHRLCRDISWGSWKLLVCGTAIGIFRLLTSSASAFKYCCRSRGEKLERSNITYGCLAKVVRDGGFTVALIARLSAIPGHCASLRLFSVHHLTICSHYCGVQHMRDEHRRFFPCRFTIPP